MLTTAESTLRAGGRVLVRRRWLIIVAVVVAVGVAIILSTTADNVYAGTAKLVVDPLSPAATTAKPSVNDLTNVRTQVEIIKSRPIAVEVSKRLGAKAQAVSAVRVRQQGKTRVVGITTESVDAKIAQDAATTYAQVYVEQRRIAVASGIQDTGRALLERVQQTQAQLADLDNRIASPGKTPAELQALRTQRDTTAAQYTQNKQRYDKAVADAASATSGVTLMQEASLPTKPVSPRPVRNGILALALGLLVGAGAAFMFEFVDDKVKSLADLTRHARGNEILGTIPALPDWNDMDATRLITVEKPTSQSANAYAALSTSLQFVATRRPLRTILVVSPRSGEGATTTVANLGVALARSGRRVICVDCDLRSPRLHTFFNLPATAGFTSVLLGDQPLSLALQNVPIASSGSLRLLAAGPLPPNPAELLATGRVAELLTAVTADADVVLIDAPALTQDDDAVALATRVGGVIVVATAELSGRRDIGRSLDLLAGADANVVGFVLNGVATHTADDFAVEPVTRPTEAVRSL